MMDENKVTGDQQPVAWLYAGGIEERFYKRRQSNPHPDWTEVPLYPHPDWQSRDTIAEQAAKIIRLERDCAGYLKAADQQYTQFREALEMVAKLAHKYRMATPERVAESYPEKRAKALDWLRDKGFCWDCESHDPFGDCMS